MDPWEVTMVEGLRQQVKDLKAENESLKQEVKILASAQTDREN
jgi:hypothetical protein